MKISDVIEKLQTASQVTLRNGIFTARWSYFYTHGATAEMYADKVKSQIPEAHIISCGDHWAAFKGGAPVNKQSHFWVKFTDQFIGIYGRKTI